MIAPDEQVERWMQDERGQLHAVSHEHDEFMRRLHPMVREHIGERVARTPRDERYRQDREVVSKRLDRGDDPRDIERQLTAARDRLDRQHPENRWFPANRYAHHVVERELQHKR